MEEELKCVICKHFYNNPILMPCYHTICLNCALNLQQSVNINNPIANNNNNHSIGTVGNGSAITSPTNIINNNVNINNNHNVNSHLITTSATVHQVDECVHSTIINNGDLSTTSSSISSEISDPDKLSLLSETDSGVICNSRPNSYVGTPNLQGFLFPPFLQTINVVSLACPVCHKVIYLDENGAHNLPRNRTLQNIVDRYEEQKQLATQCQLCEGEPKEATVMCEQCEVFYCEKCRDNCHPMRGPLAKHSVVSTNQGKQNLRLKTRSRDFVPKCSDHIENPLSSFCMFCKIPICNTCIQEGRHANHDVQALGSMCKAQKVSQK